jgi:hypothetical protein
MKIGKINYGKRAKRLNVVDTTKQSPQYGGASLN